MFSKGIYLHIFVICICSIQVQSVDYDDGQSNPVGDSRWQQACEQEQTLREPGDYKYVSSFLQVMVGKPIQCSGRISAWNFITRGQQLFDDAHLAIVRIFNSTHYQIVGTTSLPQTNMPLSTSPIIGQGYTLKRLSYPPLTSSSSWFPAWYRLEDERSDIIVQPGDMTAIFYDHVSTFQHLVNLPFSIPKTSQDPRMAVELFQSVSGF